MNPILPPFRIGSLVFILLSLAPLCAGAYGPWPPQGQQPYPGMPYQPQAQGFDFRPMPPSNARGVPPQEPQAAAPALPQQGYGYPGQGYPPGQPRGMGPYGRMPGWPQGYGQMPGYPGQGYAPGYERGYGQAPGYAAAAPARPPRLEVVVDNPRPFVQQTVLMTLRVVSSGNLESLDPTLPQNQGVSFQKLTEPKARSRIGTDGHREIINEMIFAVTPMRAGGIELSDIRAEVTLEDGATSYSIEAKTPLELQVKPPMPEPRPWLPLEQLSLESNLDAPMDVEPGKPVSLVLTLNAMGAGGNQLPTLQSYLKSRDFRIYRERTEVKQGLTRDRRHLIGKRVEHYVLVAQHSGTLKLPAVRIPWFNVNSGTVEYASLPLKTLNAGGSLSRWFQSEPGSRLFPGGSSAVFWMPLAAIALMLSGYWFGVWYRGRRSTEGVSAGRRRLLPALRAGAWIRSLLQRLGAWFPAPLRLWFWIREVDRERDPAVWCRSLQFLACPPLGMSPNASLSEMAGRIAEIQPYADPKALGELFHELDAAIYGHRNLDFAAWKRAFKRQVRPRLGNLWHRRGARPWFIRGRLPALNPEPASGSG